MLGGTKLYNSSKFFPHNSNPRTQRGSRAVLRYTARVPEKFLRESRVVSPAERAARSQQARVARKSP